MLLAWPVCKVCCSPACLHAAGDDVNSIGFMFLEPISSSVLTNASYAGIPASKVCSIIAFVRCIRCCCLLDCKPSL